LPLIVIDQRAPDELLVPINTTNFEVNPWEFGSYDASTNAYAPLEYLASDFSGGVIPSTGHCRQQFDNIGFVVGTSSSLFNQFYLNLNSTVLSSTLRAILSPILQKFGASNDDISVWPSPFNGFNNGTTNAANGNLTLVDGGEDLQNIPFHPLLRQQRQVDIIFAIDASADTDTHWPNGTAPIATYDRFISGTTFGAQGFPPVPDYNTFVNLGLNSRPTFFGCNASNQSVETPLVVYIPNAPISYHSNFSTFDLQYTDAERNSIIHNGYDVVTRGNSSLDSQWPACVGCAILSRSFNRTGETVPEICDQCFTRYCWNGTINSTVPNLYEPLVVFKQSGGIRTSFISFPFSLVVVTMLACLVLAV
jgi:lysophospholipase